MYSITGTEQFLQNCAVFRTLGALDVRNASLRAFDPTPETHGAERKGQTNRHLDHQPYPKKTAQSTLNHPTASSSNPRADFFIIQGLQRLVGFRASGLNPKL